VSKSSLAAYKIGQSHRIQKKQNKQPGGQIQTDQKE